MVSIPIIASLTVVIAWVSPAILVAAGQHIGMTTATLFSVYALAVAGILYWLRAPFSGKRAYTAAGLLLLARCLTVGAAVAGLSDDLADVLATNQSGAAVLQGTIGAVSAGSPRYSRFVFHPDANARTAGWPDKIRVSWYRSAESAPPATGERWQFDLRVRRPDGPLNPGGFDVARYLWLQQIVATAYVRDTAESVRLQVAELPFHRAWRRNVSNKLAALLAGHPALPLVQALTTGHRNNLTDEHWEVLRRTGTSHLFAISGLHIGLAGGAVLLLARLIGVPLRAAAVPALAAACLYAVLSGLGVPAQRAVLMFAAAMAALVVRRYYRAQDVFGMAVAIIVVLQPAAVFSASFWMSFVAVAVLLLVAGCLPAATGIVGVLHGAVRMQLLLVAAMSPLVLGLFTEVSLVAPLVNLLVVPLFSVVVVPGLLLAMALLPLEPVGLLHLLAGLLEALFRGLVVVAAWPVAAWSPAGVPWWAVVMAALIPLVWLLPPVWPGRHLLWLCGLPLLLPPSSGPADGVHLQVLDVGHGLAVVLRTANYTLLYDTGPRWQQSDAGSRIILPALRHSGIDRLDQVLVSHDDNDHSGGLGSVARRFPGADVFVCSRYSSAYRWRRDDVLFELRYATAAEHASENDRSCVLRISYAGHSVLLPGDIEARAEYRLLRESPDWFVEPHELLLLPHHGSATSSTNAMVAVTRPAYAVASAAHANRWGFPRQEVVQRWRRVGSCVLTTGDTGALLFELGKNGVVLRQLSRNHRLWPWQRAAKLPDCPQLRERPA